MDDNQKKLFVPYSLALTLSEYELNVKCFGYFERSTQNFWTGSGQTTRHEVPAPLFQQVTDWLLEEHEIFLSTSINIDSKEYCWEIYQFPKNKDDENDCGFSTSSDWLSTDKPMVMTEGIEEALKLIDKKP